MRRSTLTSAEPLFMPPILLTARALPSTTMPSDSTDGVAASVITMPRPCWPPMAPLATVILPVLVRVSPADAVEALLSSEHPTSSAAPASSPSAPATTRFIVLVPFVRASPRWRRRDEVKTDRTATDPKLCRAAKVQFAGDAVIHGRRTASTSGTAPFFGCVGGFDGLGPRGPRRAARHRPRHALPVAVGPAAGLRRRGVGAQDRAHHVDEVLDRHQLAGAYSRAKSIAGRTLLRAQGPNRY